MILCSGFVGLYPLLSCFLSPMLLWACLQFCHHSLHISKGKWNRFILINCHYWALVFTQSLEVYDRGTLVGGFLCYHCWSIVIQDHRGLFTVLYLFWVQIYFVQLLFSPHLCIYFLRNFSLKVLISWECVHKIGHTIPVMQNLRRLVVTLLRMFFRC